MIHGVRRKSQYLDDEQSGTMLTQSTVTFGGNSMSLSDVNWLLLTCREFMIRDSKLEALTTHAEHGQLL